MWDKLGGLPDLDRLLIPVQEGEEVIYRVILHCCGRKDLLFSFKDLEEARVWFDWDKERTIGKLVLTKDVVKTTVIDFSEI